MRSAIASATTRSRAPSCSDATPASLCRCCRTDGLSRARNVREMSRVPRGLERFVCRADDQQRGTCLERLPLSANARVADGEAVAAAKSDRVTVELERHGALEHEIQL